METFAARIAGVVAAAIVGFATEHYHVTLDPATLTVIMLGAYSLIHRLVSKQINPSDKT